MTSLLRAELPCQAEEGTVTCHHWPRRVDFPPRCSVFDAGCLLIQGNRHVYSIIVQVLTGEQSDFSFYLLLPKKAVIGFSLESAHYCDLFISSIQLTPFYLNHLAFVPCHSGREKRHAIHSPPNMQDCSPVCVLGSSFEILLT